MATDFQEFLREKVAGSDVRERHRQRQDWIAALGHLLDQIGSWLHEADPEGLLEIEHYRVQRAEARLGVYDAPALKIRLNTDEVTVLPIGRHSIGPLSPGVQAAFRSLAGAEALASGRVDITDGEWKWMLLRDHNNGLARWIAVDDRSRASVLDRPQLESILQGFWS